MIQMQREHASLSTDEGYYSNVAIPVPSTSSAAIHR
jgi:hypothetical protein